MKTLNKFLDEIKPLHDDKSHFYSVAFFRGKIGVFIYEKGDTFANFKRLTHDGNSISVDILDTDKTIVTSEEPLGLKLTEEKYHTRNISISDLEYSGSINQLKLVGLYVPNPYY